MIMCLIVCIVDKMLADKLECSDFLMTKNNVLRNEKKRTTTIRIWQQKKLYLSLDEKWAEKTLKMFDNIGMEWCGINCYIN